MEVIVKSEDVKNIQTDVLIYATTEDEIKIIDTRFEKILTNVVGSGDFKAELNKVHVLYPKDIMKAERVLLLGLGKKEELDFEKVRRAFATAIQALAGFKIKNVAIYHSNISNIQKSDFVTCMLEGIILGNYRFSKYVTENKDNILIDLQKIQIIEENVEIKNIKEIAEKTKIICDNVNFTRDLVNESGNITHPDMLENITKNFAKKHNFKFKVLKEKDLKKLGMNLLLAVGRGSPYSSRLILVEYHGDKNSDKHLILIGKGITFDTGGLNLKTSEWMSHMKDDMAGAATVLGMIKTASELKIKKNIAALIPACENMIGPNAYKPGDVIKSYDGKTVEIIDTDAEGRLILADAITYAIKNMKPTFILDFATLTGSIMRTFGNFVTGLFSNDDELSNKVYKAGQKTFECVWRMPIYDEYREDMKGDISDLKNLGPKEYGGAISAAAFLEAFVGKTRWAHFDIAGSAWFEKQRFYIPKGGTGIGIRLFVELLKEL